MKIIEVQNSALAKLLGYNITLYPFILYVGVPTEKVKKHEFVHIAQIQKLGVMKFYASYLWFYLRNRISGLNSFDAYMANPYEIEAYAKENT